MSSYTKLFKWFDEGMTLKEISAEYGHFLPFLVLIKEGFRTSKLSTKNGEIYWVHDVVKCRQFIVEDLKHRQLEIPECYSAQVIPIMPDEREEAFPFNQVQERGYFQYISFAEPMQNVRSQNSVGTYPLTNLRITDICDQDMLVVHRVFLEHMIPLSESRATGRTSKKVLPPQFKLLPCYLPIRASIALSLAELPDAVFFQTMAEMKQIVETYPHDYDVAKREAAEIVMHQEENEYSELTRIPTGLKSRQSDRSRLAQRLEELQAFYLCGKSAKPVLKQLSDFRRVHSSSSLAMHRGRKEDDGLADYLTLPEVGELNRGQGSYQSDSGQAPRASFGIGSAMASRRLAGNVAPVGRKLSTAANIQRVQAAEMLRRHGSDSSVDAARPFRGPPEHRAINALKNTQNISRSSEDVHRGSQQMPRARSLNNIVPNVADMSVNEISDFLVKLHLGKYGPAMRENQVDGQLLLCLKEESLKTEFGFSDQDAKRLMSFLKTKWSAKPK